MKTAQEMVAELGILKAACATHCEKVAKAVEVMEAAEIAFFVGFGFYPWEAPEHAVGWSKAKAAVDALKDETGYFYACSRVGDLEHLVGAGWTAQLPLFSAPTKPWSDGFSWILSGETPKAHPSVGKWVLGLFGLEGSWQTASGDTWTAEAA